MAREKKASKKASTKKGKPKAKPIKMPSRRGEVGRIKRDLRANRHDRAAALKPLRVACAEDWKGAAAQVRGGAGTIRQMFREQLRDKMVDELATARIESALRCGDRRALIEAPFLARSEQLGRDLVYARKPQPKAFRIAREDRDASDAAVLREVELNHPGLIAAWELHKRRYTQATPHARYEAFEHAMMETPEVAQGAQSQFARQQLERDLLEIQARDAERYAAPPSSNLEPVYSSRRDAPVSSWRIVPPPGSAGAASFAFGANAPGSTRAPVSSARAPSVAPASIRPSPITERAWEQMAPLRVKLSQAQKRAESAGNAARRRGEHNKAFEAESKAAAVVDRLGGELEQIEHNLLLDRLRRPDVPEARRNEGRVQAGHWRARMATHDAPRAADYAAQLDAALRAPPSTRRPPTLPAFALSPASRPPPSIAAGGTAFGAPVSVGQALRADVPNWTTTDPRQAGLFGAPPSSRPAQALGLAPAFRQVNRSMPGDPLSDQLGFFHKPQERLFDTRRS